MVFRHGRKDSFLDERRYMRKANIAAKNLFFDMIEPSIGDLNEVKIQRRKTKEVSFLSGWWPRKSSDVCWL